MYLVSVTASFVYHSNKKKKKENPGVGSYFEIWVWNASILVRVLVSSSNTFSCCTRTKGVKPKLDAFHTRGNFVLLLHQIYQQLQTCTATPKLFPSSILGIWSCTHIDTCQENLNLFISSVIYEFGIVFTAIPVIKIPTRLRLKTG